MADHYNLYSLKHFAGIVADCMNMELPEAFAETIPWLSQLLKERLGGTADRVVLYHADKQGTHLHQ